MNSIEHVLNTLSKRGALMYGGEAVTQLEHALQCASLAEYAGAPQPLVAASLLHDFGHLLPGGEGRQPAHLADDLHQYAAIPFLRHLFDDAVLEPIRLHVDAKRYLCAVMSGYWEKLSLESKLSLKQQGGVFTPMEARAFIAQPYARDAVSLRVWDDLAKTPRKETPPLSYYDPILRACAKQTSPSGRYAALSTR